MRFTQFYNTARCCPTRASLLTGLHPHQAGVGHMVDTGRQLPGYRGDLSKQCVTIAEALRPAGYHTAMSGKWHVTPVTESKHNWPLVHDNEQAPDRRQDFYFTDAIGENATRSIEEFAKGQDPFFLYVAFTAPHWPLNALEADIQE